MKTISVYNNGTIAVEGGSIATPPDPINTIVVPSDGFQYWQGLHDYETAAWEYKPRSIKLNYKKDPPYNALPEMIPLKLVAPDGSIDKGEFTDLNEAWQWFWFDLLVKSCGGTKSDAEMKQIWYDVTVQSRGLTDNHSRETGYTDYVLGVNLDANRPMGIKALSSGGNMAKQLSKYGTQITIEALDTRKAPPKVDDIWGDWSLIWWATEETTVQRPDKTWMVGRWSYLKPFGVPFPVVSGSGKLIADASRFDKVDAGRTISPYNPIDF